LKCGKWNRFVSSNPELKSVKLKPFKIEAYLRRSEFPKIIVRKILHFLNFNKLALPLTKVLFKIYEAIVTN